MTQKPNYSFAVVVCVEYLNKLAEKAVGEGKDAYATSMRLAAAAMWKERDALVQKTRDAFGDECDPRPWDWANREVA